MYTRQNYKIEIGMKRIQITQLLLFLSVSTSAQEHLQANLNMLRSDYEVLKQQIEYKTQGCKW